MMAGTTKDPLAVVGAPVEVRLEVEVDAVPEVVWALLSRPERWRLWHRGVREAGLDGGLEPGSRLLWRADGMRIVSEIREVEPERRLGFTLRTLGGRGYLRWSLEPLAPGRTLVRSEEVWDGISVRVLRRTLRRTLERSRTHGLEGLKARAEGGSSPPGGDSPPVGSGPVGSGPVEG
ncbi:MAG: hypothetical protein EA422_01370 [Gemmatimonadales bacterium]|nr:MAG: hypothetical protein EA422_01370 [Gemmatimonadales bacterium]